jgi:zinc transporter ZupT
MLKLGCVLAAISGVGLIIGAVLGVAVDTQGITTAGTIAAVSAGGMFTVAWVALVVNWYRKRTMPVEEEEEPSPSKEKPKPSSSKQKPSSSKP